MFFQKDNMNPKCNNAILAEKNKTTWAVYQQHARQVFDCVAQRVCYPNNRCNWDIVVPNSQVTVSGLTWCEEAQDKASIFRDQGHAVTEGLGLSNAVRSIRESREENKRKGTHKHKSKNGHGCLFLELLANILKLDPL